MLKFFKIHPANAYEVQDLQTFYKNIYTKCFTDINECERLADMIKYLEKSRGSVYWDYSIQIAVNEANIIVGGVIYDYMRSSNTAFIEFMCVHPDFRHKGYASDLYDEAVADLNKSAHELGYDSVRYIFGEMNKGSSVAPFHISKGLRKLELSYVQPALSTDKAPVDYLQLNAVSLDGSTTFDKDIVLSSIWAYFSYAFDIPHVEHSTEYKLLAESVRNQTVIMSTPLI